MKSPMNKMVSSLEINGNKVNYYIYRKGNWVNVDDGFIVDPIDNKTIKLAFFYQCDSSLVYVDFNDAVEALKKKNLMFCEIKKNAHKIKHKKHERKKILRDKYMLDILKELRTELYSVKKELFDAKQAQKVNKRKSSIINDKSSTVNEKSAVVIETKADVHINPTISNIQSKETQIIESDDSVGKELIIEPDVLKIIGNFAKNNTDFIVYKGKKRVPPKTFDIDDEYCKNFLYSLNPTVTIKRNKQIDMEALRQRDSNSINKFSLDDFAKYLGLVNVNKRQELVRERLRRRNNVKYVSNTQSDNQSNNIRDQLAKQKRQRNNVNYVINSDSSESLQTSVEHENSKKKHLTKNSSPRRPDLEAVLNQSIERVVEKQTNIKRLGDAIKPKDKIKPTKYKNHTRDIIVRSDKQILNMYSLIEDKIIIDFIVKNGLEKRVNGNAIWKDFEYEYQTLSGKHRTWQSLRNRYLKYILTNLCDYDITMDVEKKLRSSAFVGTIKNSMKGNKFSRLSGYKASKMPKSNWASTPALKAKSSKSLTYSAIAQRFVDKHHYSDTDSLYDDDIKELSFKEYKDRSKRSLPERTSKRRLFTQKRFLNL